MLQLILFVVVGVPITPPLPKLLLKFAAVKPVTGPENVIEKLITDELMYVLLGP